MTHRPTLQDTITRIEQALATKTASEAAPSRAPAPTESLLPPALLRKLAAHLRHEAQKPVVVTDDDLYAVLKTASPRAGRPALNINGTGPAHDLRKLAFSLRHAQQDIEDRRMQKAAATIDAAEGLTLLREQLRSFE